VFSPSKRTFNCRDPSSARSIATIDHGSAIRTCSQSVPVSDPVVHAIALWTTPISSAKKNSAVCRLPNTVPTMTPARTNRTGEVPFFHAMAYTTRNASAPPAEAMSGKTVESPEKTTSVRRIASPAPEETPRMNGLASSFRVTA
jgi:hypothetical protein